MDEFITLIIFFIVIGVIERMLKASQKSKAEAPPELEPTAEDAEPVERMPDRLQGFIAEELGLGLERKPQIRRPTEPEARPDTAGERGAAVGRQRREAVARGRRAHLERRKAAPSLREQREAERALSLEERAMLERGAPISLERPRRPEDHERFHARYMAPKRRPAVRRSRARLPDREAWSPVQKAIIWSEILRPPKGLEG